MITNINYYFINKIQDYFFKNGIFNLIHSHASLPAALDLGWKPGASGIRKVKPDVLILLGADGRKVSRADLCNEYQIEGRDSPV